jgi:hypothetical protein
MQHQFELKWMLLFWVAYEYGIDVYTVCVILGVYEHWYDIFIAHHA